MERRLISILVLDIVGYSSLVEMNETKTFEALMERRTKVIEPLLEDYGGRLIKFMGDGALIEFSSAVNAIRYAHVLQSTFKKANAVVPEAQKILLRIGISLGEVLVEDGDIYGENVNVAARIEPLAGPGEVLVSDAVFQQVSNKIDVSFEDLGEQQLKNMSKPVRVFRVQAPGSPSIDSAASGMASTIALAAGTPAPSVRSAREGAPGEQPRVVVAVLPFDNMSGDEQQNYFSDGITEDIITELSRFRELLVIARNSSFQFRGKATDVREIARKLNAQFIVEGSVRTIGSRVRITGQLIDPENDAHVWADHYDREMTDIFAIQNEISQAIAVHVAGYSKGVLAKRARERPTTSLSAYDHYLRGVDSYSHETAEALESCRCCFERATELDPNFARAWGYLAYMTMRGVINGWRPESDQDKALSYARRAAQIDPYDYYNHWDVAFVLWNRGSFPQAIERYRRALSLNANDADLLAEFGDTLVYAGEPEEGIALMRRAMAINPLCPDWYRWNMAFALFMIDDFEGSLSESAQILTPHSNVQLIAAASHAMLDQRDQARRLLHEFMSENPDYTLSMLRRRTSFRRPEDERKWLDAVREAGLKD